MERSVVRETRMTKAQKRNQRVGIQTLYLCKALFKPSLAQHLQPRLGSAVRNWQPPSAALCSSHCLLPAGGQLRLGTLWFEMTFLGCLRASFLRGTVEFFLLLLPAFSGTLSVNEIALSLETSHVTAEGKLKQTNKQKPSLFSPYW